MSRIRVLVPTPPSLAETESVVYGLGRAVRGVTVGLRLDAAWRSYEVVVDEWQRRLTADGAEPVRLITGARTGPAGDTTRTDLDAWSRLVDCGVIGLGN